MFNKKTKTIGVDVGGTKMLLQVFDKNGGLIEEEKRKTNTHSEKDFIDDLLVFIEAHFDGEIESIGIALPGIVNQEEGILLQAPHLPIKNLKLAEIVHHRFRKPVVLENDINAFLFAQSQRDEVKGMKNLIGIMVGTGVGGGIIMNGELYRGSQGFAGEVGHMIIKQEGKLNSLEQNLSGNYLKKIAKELNIEGNFDSKQLNGDSTESKKVKTHLVEQLGIGLANLSLIFDPEAIILGGSIYNLFLSPEKKTLEKIIKKHTLSKTSPELLDADENYSVALGIAMMSQRNA